MAVKSLRQAETTPKKATFTSKQQKSTIGDLKDGRRIAMSLWIVLYSGYSLVCYCD